MSTPDPAAVPPDAPTPAAVEAPLSPEAPAAPGPESLPVADADGTAPPAGGPDRGPGPTVVAARLAERFPAVFTPGQPRPLKLRIQADIQQLAPGEFSRKMLGIVLQRHTTSTAYLKALLAQPERIGLDGQPSGPVDPEHREAARVELERRRSRWGAGRPAELPSGEAAPSSGRPPRAPRPAPGDRTEGPGGEGAPASRRGHRPPRGPRGEPAAESPRRGPGAPGRPTREGRPLRPEDRARDGRPPRGEDRPREARPADRPPRREDGPALDPAQAERAALLRAFETSPLSRANFCALKRLAESELDAVLAQARAERTARSGGSKPA